MSVRAARWRAIGTNVDLLVRGLDLGAARAAVERVIGDADAALSRFRDDSEVSVLQGAPGQPVAVSQTLARALDAALRAAQLTDGLVDPTVGRVLRLAGYDRDFAFVRDRDLPPRIEVVPGWRAIEWRSAERLLRLPRGIELDFGSTGKALIVDDCARALLPLMRLGAGALISIGGDMGAVGAAPAGGWRVLLAENSVTTTPTSGDTVSMQHGALATSSTTVRRWRDHGEVVHHLIDPRTARPATGPWRTASVVAADCVDANTAATAAIILGEDAADWLTRHQLAARLVARDGGVTYVGGWPVQGLVAA
ncbi:MAG: FAD:protein FMN transferase [Candidatus Limnocylindrales bacterium]